jgi:hypothetical protein
MERSAHLWRSTAGGGGATSWNRPEGLTYLFVRQTMLS